MKTKIKIIIAVLAGIIGILAFFIFSYPDEKLQDLSDLVPSIQNVDKENNAYYLVEEAGANYKEPQFDPRDIISFLTNNVISPGEIKNKKSKFFSQEDIDQFLNLEDASIKLLEQAEQLPYFKNPKEDKYQTLTLAESISVSNPSTLTLLRVLVVKGIYEFEQGQSDEGLQTIIQAMELAAKIRRSSFNVIESSINAAIIRQGKAILKYFANNGAAIPAEIEARIAELNDGNFQDAINALKFEFQIEKNALDELDELIKDVGPFKNRFNFRKNATINGFAMYMRDFINLTKSYDCETGKSSFKSSFSWESLHSSGAPWTYLIKENGIGQMFIAAILPSISPKAFCDN